MTIKEAKEVFINRGFVNGLFDGDKWRESVAVISKWLEQEPIVMDVVHVVTADGTTEYDYGSEIYLIGVFKDRKSAEAIISKYPDLSLTVTRIEVEKEYPMIRCDPDLSNGYENDNYLGGYTE